MTATLVFPPPMLADLREALLTRDDVETVALVFTRLSGDGAGRLRLLAIKTVLPVDDDYLQREPLRAVLRPAALAQAVAQARKAGMGVVVCHSHPFCGSVPEFSSIDDEGEREIVEFLDQRIPGLPHAAMVVAPSGLTARLLGTGTPLRVFEAGHDLTVASLPGEGAVGHIHHRQVLAFGEAGQRIIGSLRVGVVGAGGTGSVTIPQLAHLGVRDFVVTDPDFVEDTNLNRLLGCGPEDVGKPKADMTARMILAIAPHAQVLALRGDVLDLPVSRQLAGCDIVFCCTDSAGSRYVLNRLAYQHFVPVIDMGSEISANDGVVQRVAGRVRLLSPGLGCLVCSNALDTLAVKRELACEAARRADAYGADQQVPQPAVISLNAAVSALAVQIFLGMVTGLPMRARFQNYDALNGTVRAAIPAHVENCVCCRSFFGAGNSEELPFRQI